MACNFSARSILRCVSQSATGLTLLPAGASISATITGVWAGEGDQHHEAQQLDEYSLQSSRGHQVATIAIPDTVAIPSLLQKYCTGQAPMAHSQETAAACVTW